MKSLKELKAIKIVPFTLMTASLNAVWGFIFAIIFLIFGGFIASIIAGTELAPLSGAILGISVAGLVVFPVGSFLLSIVPHFLQALFYNLLVPRLGAIKIEIEEMTEIVRAEVVPFALIVAAVLAIIQFLYELVASPLQAVFLEVLSGLAATAATPAEIPAELPMMLQTGALGAVLNIVISPILTFIGVFIGTAILVALYNLLTPKLGGIKVELAQMADNYFGVEKINPVSIGLILGAISAVIGLIMGIIVLIIAAIGGAAVEGLITLLGLVIGGFIGVFIVYAITAYIYNLLAPRIGSYKIKLE